MCTWLCIPMYLSTTLLNDVFFFFLMMRRPPISTLFPYTTLFRSSRVNDQYILFENRAGFEGGVFQNAAVFNPTLPIMVNDTTYYEVPGSQSLRNPVALVNQVSNLGQTTRTLANGSAELDIVPGLTGQVTVGLDYSAGGRQIYFPIANPLGRTLGNGLARVYSQDSSTKTGQTMPTYW